MPVFVLPFVDAWVVEAIGMNYYHATLPVSYSCQEFFPKV